jgi:hypothetical protein
MEAAPVKQDRIIVENVVRAGEAYLLMLVSAAVSKVPDWRSLDKTRTELLDAVEKLVQASNR